MKLNLLLAIMASTLFVGMSVPSFASSVRLQWDPNTESDLAGYKLYYKQGSSAEPYNGIGAWEGNSPIQLQNQTTAIISGLDPGATYYFAVTAYNTAGLESPYSNVVSETILEVDTSAPMVSTFTIPSTTSLLTVPITAITASDNVGVTGYLLTQSATTIPAISDAGWTPAPLASFSFSSAGSKTLCAWAKDAAGNISNGICRSVTITLPDTTKPLVNAFSMPATASTLDVQVSSLAATDNIGVSGYLITESATEPTASAVGWTSSVPTSFTFSGTGIKTAYAWAKDSAGNVSVSRSTSVAITLPDTIPPTISFSTPAGGANVSGSVTITATASDNIGVNKVEFYINGVLTQTDSATPFSFMWNTTLLANGSYTLTAMAYDAAGNTSASQLTVKVNNIAKDTVAPVVAAFTSVNVRFSPRVVLTATATDNVGVVKMTVSANGRQIASANAAKISWTFKDLAPGKYTVVIRAYDAAGNVGSKTATVYR